MIFGAFGFDYKSELVIVETTIGIGEFTQSNTDDDLQSDADNDSQHVEIEQPPSEANDPPPVLDIEKFPNLAYFLNCFLNSN